MASHGHRVVTGATRGLRSRIGGRQGFGKTVDPFSLPTLLGVTPAQEDIFRQNLAGATAHTLASSGLADRGRGQDIAPRPINGTTSSRSLQRLRGLSGCLIWWQEFAPSTVPLRKRIVPEKRICLR